MCSVSGSGGYKIYFKVLVQNLFNTRSRQTTCGLDLYTIYCIIQEMIYKPHRKLNNNINNGIEIEYNFIY